MAQDKDPDGLQKAVTFSDFLRMLEHGELHQKLGDMLREIAGSMENYAAENGGEAKAKLTLTIDFKKEKGLHYIVAKPKMTLPEPKPSTTVAWTSPENFFTAQDPKQLVMFGGPRKVEDPVFGAGSGSGTA
ncbi:MAG TPA: hypothetical protein VEC60_15725 [Reyranella sp.]|nr:hypothetical protein [Reyranella sp.]